MKRIKCSGRLAHLVGAAAAIVIGNLAAAACGSSGELVLTRQAEGTALAGAAIEEETARESAAENAGRENGESEAGNAAGENAAQDGIPAESSGEERQTEETREADPAWIYVDVCGAVEQPGVYCLEEGARVCDAVRAAGGFSLAAVETSVNQARILTDQEQLYIYTQEELEALETGEYPGTPAGALGLDRAAGTEEAPDGAGASGSSGARSGAEAGKVDLNTATAAQLETLPGIGAAKAEAILSYRREKGSFRSVQELKNVSGIGEATYAGLEAYITVGS